MINSSSPKSPMKRVSQPGWTSEKSLTYEALVKCVKYDVAQCGMDPADYAGHSFIRAGGATELFASDELSIAQIMKLGSWRTLEACLVYYIDELEVSRRAGEVFGKQAADCLMRG